MKKYNVGVQLFSVRNELKEDMDKTLGEIKAMGYDYVQFAEFCGKSAEEIKALADKHGLKTTSIHWGIAEILNETEKTVADMKTLGIKHFVLPSVPREYLFEDFEEGVEKFKKAAAICKENGMMLGYHNHAAEFETVDGQKAIDRLIDAVGLDNLLPEFDVGWMESSGEVPAKYMEKYAGKIPLLHMKDYDRVDGKLTFVPCGSGLLDIPAVLEAADKYGVEDIIVEQDGGCLEDIRKSREYLKTLGI